jgi:hypothetical protein
VVEVGEGVTQWKKGTQRIIQALFQGSLYPLQETGWPLRLVSHAPNLLVMLVGREGTMDAQMSCSSLLRHSTVGYYWRLDEQASNFCHSRYFDEVAFAPRTMAAPPSG